MKHGKKYNDSAKLIETGKFYDVDEAVAIAVKTGTAKLMKRLKFMFVSVLTHATRTSR